MQPDYPPFDLTIPDNTGSTSGSRSSSGSSRRQPAGAVDHPARRRPHERHPRRCADAARDDCRERPGARPCSSRRSATAATGATRPSSCSKTTPRTAPITSTRTARRRSSISPYVRRGAVDSTLYTTSGVLRTMELILGLPPMSQYDAAATPMYHAFQITAVPAPFAHLDARVSLDEVNGADAPGAAASARMDFRKRTGRPNRAERDPLAVDPRTRRRHAAAGARGVRPAGCGRRRRRRRPAVAGAGAGRRPTILQGPTPASTILSNLRARGHIGGRFGRRRPFTSEAFGTK